MTILELIQKGYTLREITGKMGIDNSNISKRLNTICMNTVKEYELKIRKEESKRYKAYFKNCTKCNEFLPESAKFFYMIKVINVIKVRVRNVEKDELMAHPFLFRKFY
ncbi:hypothetical protein GGGNBK_14195 [Sporosarcina sp. ANT_H38]